jgi:type VI secretion system protein ImpK
MFPSGSATVAGSFSPVLGDIAKCLARTSGTILVTGHTDNHQVHTVQFRSNFDLSQTRAESVRTMLIQDGVDAGRLHPEGHAEQEPIASNDTEEGRAKNRRIEFLVSNQSGEWQ